MAQKIRIIGVPMDLGASRRGVDMGPSALRVAGLQARIKQLGHQVEDIGNISVKQPEEMSYGEKRAKYLAEIADACKDLAGIVEKSLDESMLPVVLGGDHSIAAGWLFGSGELFQEEREEGRFDLVGCARGHQYAGIFAFGKRARDAAGCGDGLRSDRTCGVARI